MVLSAVALTFTRSSIRRKSFPDANVDALANGTSIHLKKRPGITIFSVFLKSFAHVPIH
jgi:hypothetical protein